MDSYSSYTDWQQRVIEEKMALEARMYKLAEFMDSSEWKDVSPAEKHRLHLQFAAMELYQSILADRVDNFLESKCGHKGG